MQEDIEQRISAIYHAHYQDVYYFLLHFTGNQTFAISYDSLMLKKIREDVNDEKAE
ncbi:hypothetical protein BBR47_49190 [Brevibacillus brevis NBRC 100599]|uniref:Uncharacterized protein n=1 Tax=Brevibacillus brevis (strain 47 / JCM 6285 / NBRC 100599) TaxID=358681 RepID=C0ZL69_BREBN|nr:hypothetical protein [Brevibacillus brevis]BAH45896.1 hypothetical protein BBR47_49190 [Brevibacillus brevis NBRC 100599]